jgi:hypothetical protein
MALVHWWHWCTGLILRHPSTFWSLLAGKAATQGKKTVPHLRNRQLQRPQRRRPVLCKRTRHRFGMWSVVREKDCSVLRALVWWGCSPVASRRYARQPGSQAAQPPALDAALWSASPLPPPRPLPSALSGQAASSFFFLRPACAPHPQATSNGGRWM